jgi:hypothetical protein
MVAAAAVGSAVVGGYVSSQNAKKAAKSSEKGSDAAAQVQWDMYDQSRKDQMPWLGTGQNALRQLAALNGVMYSDDPEATKPLSQRGGSIDSLDDLNQLYREVLGRDADSSGGKYYLGWDVQDVLADMRGSDEYNRLKAAGKLPKPSSITPVNRGGFSQRPDYSAFFNSPDYQFAFQEGNRAVNAGLAARGLSNSGRAMKELTRYGQGAASQQLNTYRNALAAMAGVGQTTAANLGSQGMQAGQIIGQAKQNSADARASGYLGQGNAWSNAINQGIGAGAYMYGRSGDGGYDPTSYTQVNRRYGIT